MADLSAISLEITGSSAGLVGAVGQAERSLAGLEGKAGGVGPAFGVMAAAATAAGVGIAAGLATGIKAAGDLQQSVANIATIKPEIDTSAVFGALNEMTTRIPQSADQLGSALYNVFSSVNVTAEEGLRLTETFAKGAIGASTDAQTFGTAAMGVMNAYGLSVSDASHISDVFFNTIAAGVVEGPELAASLGPVTAAAKAAGVSLDEMGAMIVGVTKQGGPAAQNINNLNNLLQKLTTTSAQGEMQKLGVVTTDATGKFRPQIEVLRDLRGRLDGMTESAKAAALQEIFPDMQARQGAQAIMDQLTAVDAALETNRMSTGSTADAYAKMSATFNSQSKLLTNTLTSIATSVGGEILPFITPVVTAFAQTLPGAFQATRGAVEPMVQVLGDAGRTIGQVFGEGWEPSAAINPFVNAVGIAAAGTRDLISMVQGLPEPVKAAGLAFAGVMVAAGPLSLALKALPALFGLLAAPIAAVLSPLGLLAAGIAGLAAAWTSNVGDIQGKTSELLGVVGPAFGQLGTIVQTAISGDIAGAFEQFKTLVTDTGTQLAPLLAAWGTEFVTWIQVAGPPMLAAAATMGADLLTWIGTNAPAIAAGLVTWAQEFAAWVAPAIPPLITAATALGGQLLAWIGAQIPVWTAQLALWGAEFVAWVGPQIPPLLTAAADLGTQLLGWIAEQVPPLIAQLATWGAELIAWVGPQIPPLLSALGHLGLAVIDWMIAQVPTITAKLVEWGILFGAWVATTAIPELGKALPGIVATIIEWAVAAQIQITARLVAFGTAIVTGIYDGFTAAWATIGPKIMEAIAGAFKMPSFSGGGGGGGGATNLSLNTGGANTHVGPYMNLIQQISAEENEDPALVAALMETEGSGAGSTSPAGAKGLMQTMPNWTRPGEDPHDPATSIRLGIRAIKAKRAAVGNDPASIAGAYFGYGTDAGGMTTGRYQEIFREKYRRYQGATTDPMNRLPLGTSMGAGPTGPFAPGSDQWGHIPLSLEEIVRLAPEVGAAFGSIGVAGTTAGTALVSASTDSMGNVTRIYSDGAGQMTSTITNAAGQVVGQWGTMTQGVTAATEVLATTVPQQFDLMAAGSLTSAAALGTGLQTTTTDMSGNTVSTITEMGGMVLAQFATLSNGAIVNMETLGTTSTKTMNDAGTAITQVVTDLAGNVITTTTDMSGKVIAQTVRMAGESIGATEAMHTDVVAEAQTMAAETALEAQTMAADAALAAGLMQTDVVAAAATMNTDTVGAAGEMQTGVVAAAGTMVTDFGTELDGLGTPIETATGLMEGIGETEIPAPDIDDVLDAMKEVEKAAKKAAEAIKDIGDAEKGGSSGSGKGNPFGKGGGGDDDDDDDDDEDSEGDRVSALFKLSRVATSALDALSPSGGRFGGNDSVIDYDRLAQAVAKALQGNRNNYVLNHTSNAPVATTIQDFAILEAMGREQR